MTVIRLKDFATGTALARTVGVTSSDVAGGRANADLVTDLLATAGVPAAIGAGATFLPSGTDAVAVTLQNKLRERVSVKDFGAVGDGATSDTAAFRAAVLAHPGKDIFVPKGTYLVTWFSVPSYTTLIGEGPESHIIGTEANTIPIDIQSKTEAKVKSIKVTKQAAGTHTVGAANIRIYQSTRCEVEDCVIEDFTFSGITVFDSTYCTIKNNYISDAFATADTDTSGGDIIILRNSHYNTVYGNKCFGGTHIGIAVWDDWQDTTPIGNKIINNFVSGQKDYGIIVYVGAIDYDSKSLVEGNYVWDIAGKFYNIGLSGKAFGGAIYIQHCGGTTVRDNHCWDFCQETTLFGTLAPGGIGVTTIHEGVPPVIVAGNHIHSIRGPCINITDCEVPVIIEANEMRQEGTGVGTGSNSVMITNGVGAKLNNNIILHDNADYYAVIAAAVGKEVAGISLTNNDMNTLGSGILLYQSGGGSFARTKIQSNEVYGGSLTALLISDAADTIVSANHFSTSGMVLYTSACLRTRISQNHLKSTGAGITARFAGTGNTGSIMDHTNSIECQIENDAGSGVWIETLGTAAPAYTGIHDLGARVINSAPTVGQPKAWRCTTAGNPGTWTSEGNL